MDPSDYPVPPLEDFSPPLSSDDGLDYPLPPSPEVADSVEPKIRDFRALKPGFQIHGYRILRRIGSGTMGKVYEARQLNLQRRVALKVLSPRHIGNRIWLDRFEREARALAKIQHRGIVPIYDLFEERGLYFIAMGYVEGGSLRDQIKEKGKLPETQACAIIRQAAQALWAASEKGIVHRDVKPDNLLLTPQGRVRVVDFGVVKEEAELSEITPTGTFLGTPMYMAPEQWRDSHAAGHRSDLYALGCILFELLAGRPPFTASSTQQLMRQHLIEDPPSLRELNPEVSSGLAILTMRLLEKDPERRIQNGAEVAELLLHIESRAAARLARRDEEGERRCDECGRIHPDNALFCADCAAALIDNPFHALVDQVFGQYRLDKLLSVGPLGAVFQATRLDVRQYRAIRILSPELARDQLLVDELMRKTRVCAEIESPHVLQVETAFLADGLFFIAYLWLEGGSLRELLDEREVLAESEALDYARQVALGLEAAHARDVTHGDLRPGTILISGGQVRLTGLDFLPSVGTGTVGNPVYRAPELLLEPQSPDARADLYSLGCCLCEMLTGWPPFHIQSRDSARILRFLEGIPEIPARLSDLSEATARVLEKLLKRDPSARGGDAGAQAVDLEEALATIARAEGERLALAVWPPDTWREGAEEAFTSEPRFSPFEVLRSWLFGFAVGLAFFGAAAGLSRLL